MKATYKARREAKHVAEKAAKRGVAPVSVGTIDLTRKVPALSFIGARMYRQSGLQRKGCSGHLLEHTEALAENAARRGAGTASPAGVLKGE